MKEGFYLLGLEKTSPTFAAAMQNSVPALTFLMAALLRQATIFKWSNFVENFVNPLSKV